MAEKNTNNANNAKAGKGQIFREKSLKQIENPEKLNDYLRVTSAGVWLVLVTVIVLLAGVVAWGFLGRIHSTVQAAVVTENGKSTCLVPASALESVMKYRKLTIDGEERTLLPFTQEPETITESTNIYTVIAGNLSVGDLVYPVRLAKPLAEDGIVSGILTTETISPAELFFEQ